MNALIYPCSVWRKNVLSREIQHVFGSKRESCRSIEPKAGSSAMEAPCPLCSASYHRRPKNEANTRHSFDNTSSQQPLSRVSAALQVARTTMCTHHRTHRRLLFVAVVRRSSRCGLVRGPSDGELVNSVTPIKWKVAPASDFLCGSVFWWRVDAVRLSLCVPPVHQNGPVSTTVFGRVFVAR
jgi:hypothetical protein